MRYRYLKVAISPLLYAALQREADRLGITLAELIRQRLGTVEETIDIVLALTRIDEKLAAPVASQAPAMPAEMARALVETLLLTRELVADRNPQIIARVAQQLAVREKAGV